MVYIYICINDFIATWNMHVMYFYDYQNHLYFEYHVHAISCHHLFDDKCNQRPLSASGSNCRKKKDVKGVPPIGSSPFKISRHFLLPSIVERVLSISQSYQWDWLSEFLQLQWESSAWHCAKSLNGALGLLRKLNEIWKEPVTEPWEKNHFTTCSSSVFFSKKIHKTTENLQKDSQLQKSCQEYTFGFFKPLKSVFSRALFDQCA